MKLPHLALWIAVSSCPFACGGGKAGGPTVPALRPNFGPSMQVPSGLGGTSPSYTLTLPIAGSQTLTFAATDPDGDPLLWQVGVAAGGATAAGLAFTSPVAGPVFTLGVEPVAAAAAVSMSLLVEDPRGAAAAIDLLVVRTGAPSISAVAPGSAFAGKPQRITVTGSALRLGGQANTAVRFDGLLATGLLVPSETTATCSTPAAASPGDTVVSVTNQFGTAALPASAFTLYQYPPSFFATDAPLDNGTASALQLVVDGAAIHGVWLEGSSVVYRNSTDAGANWSAPQPLGGAQTLSEPQVLAAGMDVGVAWIENGTVVRFARSTDGGATFEPAVRLDTTSLPGTPISRPRLCQSGSRRYASWLAGVGTVGGGRVVATGSADAGAIWSTPAPVADAMANQGNHEIACDGTIAWVQFEDDRLGAAVRGIYVVRTVNGGSVWGTARRLNTATSAAGQARFAAAAGRVHACWVQNDALYHNVSSDNGLSWSSTINVVQTVQSGVVSAPAICCEDDRVWFAYVAGGTTVWVSRYTPLGTSVQHTPVEVGTTLVSGEPCIRSAGNYLFVAWREGDVGSGAARIQQAVSGDGGATFPVPAGLGDGTASQTSPQLLVDGARLLLGWLDSRGASTGVFVNRTAQ